MKQIEDSKTCDMLDVQLASEAPKRSSGRVAGTPALTAAQRQALRRERLRAAGGDVLTITVTSEVAAALRKFVQFKDMTQGDAVTKILSDRLLRKR